MLIEKEIQKIELQVDLARPLSFCLARLSAKETLQKLCDKQAAAYGLLFGCFKQRPCDGNARFPSD